MRKINDSLIFPYYFLTSETYLEKMMLKLRRLFLSPWSQHYKSTLGCFQSPGWLCASLHFHYAHSSNDFLLLLPCLALLDLHFWIFPWLQLELVLSQHQCSHYHLHHNMFSIVALCVYLFFFPPLLFEKWNAGSTFTYEQKESEADSLLQGSTASHRFTLDMTTLL